MWICINCKEESEDDFDVCWNCQYTRGGEPPGPRAANTERPPHSWTNAEPLGTSSEAWVEPAVDRSLKRVPRADSGLEGDYRVVPFIGRIRQGIFSSQNASDVSRQLESVINEHAALGWEFQSIEKVNIEVSPGCIGSLFGATSTQVAFDQVVFRRMRT